MTNRELDVKVAKALGLNIVAIDWPCGYPPDGGGYESAPVFQPNPENKNWKEPIPFYSTDIVEAFEGPLKTMMDDGWEIEISCSKHKYNVVFYPPLYHRAPFLILDGYESLPEVICVAFLRVKDLKLLKK